MRWIWLYSVCRIFKSNLSFRSRISYVTYSGLYRHAWKKKRMFAGNILCCYLCLYLNLIFSSKECNSGLALWKVWSVCFTGLSKIESEVENKLLYVNSNAKYSHYNNSQEIHPHCCRIRTHQTQPNASNELYFNQPFNLCIVRIIGLLVDLTNWQPSH